jgi:hypothetical protein
MLIRMVNRRQAGELPVIQPPRRAVRCRLEAAAPYMHAVIAERRQFVRWQPEQVVVHGCIERIKRLPTQGQRMAQRL